VAYKKYCTSYHLCSFLHQSSLTSVCTPGLEDGRDVTDLEGNEQTSVDASCEDGN